MLICVVKMFINLIFRLFISTSHKIRATLQFAFDFDDSVLPPCTVYNVAHGGNTESSKSNANCFLFWHLPEGLGAECVLKN